MSNGYVYVGTINNPYLYGQTFANAANQYAPQLSAYAGEKLANQYQKEQGSEETLLGSILGGGLFMSAFHLPKVIHPFKTKQAIDIAVASFHAVHHGGGVAFVGRA